MDAGEIILNEECASQLASLSGKRYNLLTKRGNVSIRLALRFAKKLGYAKVLVQDQGGWLTYDQFAKKEKLELVELKTGCGLLSPVQLKPYSKCILLINSMPGYLALQNMKEICGACHKQNIFVINDASGSIGTEQAKFGDIILASFGIDKPVNAGEGGFIATSDEKAYDFIKDNNPEIEIDLKKVIVCLVSLGNRLQKLKDTKTKLIKALQSTEFAPKIILEKEKGINLAVKFDDESQKEKLIKLAEEFGIEHTVCPRKIRVLEKAVCFEIKRLQ